jgi:hypothetical protein
MQIIINDQYKRLFKEHKHVGRALLSAAEKLMNAKDESYSIVDDLRIERLASVGGCLITCPGLSPRPVVGRIIY